MDLVRESCFGDRPSFMPADVSTAGAGGDPESSSQSQTVDHTPKDEKHPAEVAAEALAAKFQMQEGYISNGGDLGSETLTLQEAFSRVAEMPKCKGFSIMGPPPKPDEDVLVYFKDKWEVYVDEAQTWTSYRYDAAEVQASVASSESEGQSQVSGSNARAGRIGAGNVGQGNVNVLELGRGVNAITMPWGLALDSDEHVLWGPVLFETELWRSCWLTSRGIFNFRRPSALVAITSRRLVVVRYRTQGSLACMGIMHKAVVESVACVPLKWISGFNISETFTQQRAVITKKLADCCCLPSTSSTLTVQIMTNAGFGKTYLGALTVEQTAIPRTLDCQCYFESDKIIELRRWLGNLALFYYAAEDTPLALDLFTCEGGRGVAPS